MPHNGTLYIDGHSWNRACIQLHDLIFGRILRKELLAPDHYLMIYLFRLLICERWTKQGRSLSLHFHWLIPCTFYLTLTGFFPLWLAPEIKLNFIFLESHLEFCLYLFSILPLRTLIMFSITAHAQPCSATISLLHTSDFVWHSILIYEK